MIDTFPYLVLLILVIGSCTLPGAKERLIYLFKPKWNDLLKKTDINNVVAQSKSLFDFFNKTRECKGPDLVFSVYPEAIGTMKLAPLWSICYYLLVLILK